MKYPILYPTLLLCKIFLDIPMRIMRDDAIFKNHNDKCRTAIYRHINIKHMEYIDMYSLN